MYIIIYIYYTISIRDTLKFCIKVVLKNIEIDNYKYPQLQNSDQEIAYDSGHVDQCARHVNRRSCSSSVSKDTFKGSRSALIFSFSSCSKSSGTAC